MLPNGATDHSVDPSRRFAQGLSRSDALPVTQESSEPERLSASRPDAGEHHPAALSLAQDRYLAGPAVSPARAASRDDHVVRASMPTAPRDISGRVRLSSNSAYLPAASCGDDEV